MSKSQSAEFQNKHQYNFDIYTTDSIINEAQEIINDHGNHFLLTPYNNFCLVNGFKKTLPNISNLLNQITPNGYSIVFAFDQFTLIDFIKSLIKEKQAEVDSVIIKYGVQFIPCNTTNYVLSGGSFSTVTLNLESNRWRVSKLIEGELGDIDADIRLIQEADYISSLPIQAAKHFPYVKKADVSSAPPIVGYHMEYCPYPTISELINMKKFSPNEIIQHIQDIYNTLLEDLYSLNNEDKSDANHDDYYSRIDRRINRTLNMPEGIGEDLKKLIQLDAVIIDGKEMQGFWKIYEQIKSNKHLKSLAIPPDSCCSHGDMILEDILLNPYTNKFKLIDPNGGTHSKYYDVAKTLLSLSTYYELFYFDKFSLEFDKNGQSVNIHFEDEEIRKYYEEMNSEFWSFIEDNANRFFNGEEKWKLRLMLLNGLQNISIVMFHLIHHKKESRAIAFLLMGITKLNQFLQYYEKHTK